ncbi:MAG: glycosyltransferase [bacterium]|nr:glycosyltransferase [bacterium]
MIRLVHILTSFDIGGAEQLVLDICRRLDRKRFDVSVVAVVRGGPLRPEFHEAGIPTEVIGKTSKLGLRTIRTLTEVLQRPRPDIVHTHLFGGDTWGRIAAFRAGVPHVVSTEHNINVDEGFVKRLVKRRLAERTERIVAVSDAVRSTSLRVDHIPRGKVVVIPNGVDLERFHPSERRPSDRTRFIGIGRFVPQKGFDVLIDAFAVLRSTLPRASLMLVGNGPQHTHLEAQIRAYHLEDRVQLLGLRRDIADLLTTADIAVVPSRWEGFGLAALEASASGLPVIASAVGGLREVIVDQETGMLVPPEEPKILADTMRDLGMDRPRQVLFGHAGRRHVERHFDINRVVQRYAELYEDLARQ